MEGDQSKTIAVLGMHRSGTSMMGGILKKLGMSPGNEDRLFSNKYNIKGYFEDIKIIRCNEKILSSQVNRSITGIHDSDSFVDKATLDGFGWIYGAWVNQRESKEGDKYYSHLINDALSCFAKEGALQKFRFIKDPRMSLTLKKWSMELKFDAAVVMIRNPESVVKSILARNHIIDYIGYDLWQLYTCNALLNVQQIPHVIVDYDTILSDKQQTLDRLLLFLRETIDFKPSEKVQKEALQSIIQDLNHKHTNPSVNKPKENILYLYDIIKTEQIGDLENEFRHRFATIKDNWISALYVAEKYKRIYYTAKFRERMERLNRHILVGNLLALLRRIKKDQTFGSTSDI